MGPRRLTLSIACVLAVACDGRLQQPPADPACTHPCDLAQTVHIDIVGDEPAASVTVTGPCGGGIPDCAPLGGCRSIMLYLSNGGPGSDSGPKVCQVTAVSASGAVVERDLTASYQGSFCCSGYEFSSLAATIDFSTADAGIASPDAAGDAGTTSRDAAADASGD